MKKTYVLLWDDARTGAVRKMPCPNSEVAEFLLEFAVNEGYKYVRVEITATLS